MVASDLLRYSVIFYRVKVHENKRVNLIIKGCIAKRFPVGELHSHLLQALNFERIVSFEYIRRYIFLYKVIANYPTPVFFGTHGPLEDKIRLTA